MSPDLVEFLLADDNEDDIILMEQSFEDARIANPLNKVRDGAEALAYLRKEGKYADVATPGLVILDINMPKMTGFEVLAEMKADPRLRHVPVVMLTTSDRDADVVRSYATGACSFISKPLQFDAFRRVVNEISAYWLGVVRLPNASSDPPPSG